ncbi:MAG: hypothetical protein ACRD2B_16140 [Terriglobia bacterium]
MRGRMLAGLLALMIAAPGLVLGQHNPLLPRPQEIRYGVGHVPVRGLAIAFGTRPIPEDRFAAAEIASVLSKRSGSRI